MIILYRIQRRRKYSFSLVYLQIRAGIRVSANALDHLVLSVGLAAVPLCPELSRKKDFQRLAYSFLITGFVYPSSCTGYGTQRAGSRFNVEDEYEDTFEGRVVCRKWSRHGRRCCSSWCNRCRPS